MFDVKTISRTEEDLRMDIINLFTGLAMKAPLDPILLETYQDEHLNAYHLIARAEFNEEDEHQGIIFAITLQADALNLDETIGILKQDFLYTAVDADEVYDCFQKAITKQRETINEEAERFDWSLPE